MKEASNMCLGISGSSKRKREKKKSSHPSLSSFIIILEIFYIYKGIYFRKAWVSSPKFLNS
jgi:hypothetical protein